MVHSGHMGNTSGPKGLSIGSSRHRRIGPDRDTHGTNKHQLSIRREERCLPSLT